MACPSSYSRLSPAPAPSVTKQSEMSTTAWWIPRLCEMMAPTRVECAEWAFKHRCCFDISWLLRAGKLSSKLGIFPRVSRSRSRSLALSLLSLSINTLLQVALAIFPSGKNIKGSTSRLSCQWLALAVAIAVANKSTSNELQLQTNNRINHLPLHISTTNKLLFAKSSPYPGTTAWLIKPRDSQETLLVSW